MKIELSNEQVMQLIECVDIMVKTMGVKGSVVGLRLVKALQPDQKVVKNEPKEDTK